VNSHPIYKHEGLNHKAHSS